MSKDKETFTEHEKRKRSDEEIQRMTNEVLQRYNARNVLNYTNKKGETHANT